MIPDDPTEDQAKDTMLLLRLARKTEFPGFVYVVFLWEDQLDPNEHIHWADPKGVTFSA